MLGCRLNEDAFNIAPIRMFDDTALERGHEKTTGLGARGYLDVVGRKPESVGFRTPTEFVVRWIGSCAGRRPGLGPLSPVICAAGDATPQKPKKQKGADGDGVVPFIEIVTVTVLGRGFGTACWRCCNLIRAVTAWHSASLQIVAVRNAAAVEMLSAGAAERFG